MEWFTGDVTQAITKCKTQNLVLVVYIRDDNEDSQAMDEIWRNSEVLEEFRLNCVCLNFEAESLQGQQFSQIYPVLVLPSIFVLSGAGIPLEVIVGKCSADDLKNKANNLLQSVQPTPPISDTNTTSLYSDEPTDSQSEQASVSDYTAETRARLAQASGGSDVAQIEESREEKIKRARELIQQKQRENAEAANQKAKVEEVKRRELGRDVGKLKLVQKEQEGREVADKMKKDKEETRLAREKVRQQIAEDREARAVKFNKEKKEQDDEKRQKEQEKLRKAAEEAERIAIANSSRARIQFRLPDGSSINTDFDADDELSNARRFILESEKNQVGARFRLAAIFPRRVFTDEDYTSTFRQLSLCPTSALLVLPPALGSPGSSSTSSGSSMYSTIMLILSPLIYLWNSISSFVFAQPPSVRPAPTNQQQESSQPEYNARPETQASSEQPSVRRRVGRLSDLSREADDTNTWNGNSTQQQ